MYPLHSRIIMGGNVNILSMVTNPNNPTQIMNLLVCFDFVPVKLLGYILLSSKLMIILYPSLAVIEVFTSYPMIFSSCPETLHRRGKWLKPIYTA